MSSNNDPLSGLIRMFAEALGGGNGPDLGDVWRRATESKSKPASEPSADEQRENLAFALGTRAVEALEDLNLNLAAMRQMLERREGGYPAGRRPVNDKD